MDMISGLHWCSVALMSGDNWAGQIPPGNDSICGCNSPERCGAIFWACGAISWEHSLWVAPFGGDTHAFPPPQRPDTHTENFPRMGDLWVVCHMGKGWGNRWSVGESPATVPAA